MPIAKEPIVCAASARNQYRALLETQKRQKVEGANHRKKECIDDEVETRKKKKLKAAVAELTTSADSGRKSSGNE